MRLAELSVRLASARQSDRARYRHFFVVLGARVEAARAVDRKLDRMLARRFNALDYLRTDELGLSRIIGDLLDPDGAHGQGPRFLMRFADMAGSAQWPTDRAVRCGDFEVEVVRERQTDGGGFLDISVELRLPGRKAACIVIENKPYADDGDAQIENYLEFLRSRYPRRFLLIHLSPDGRRPKEHSLPKDACMDGLATMSYRPQTVAGEREDDLRLPFSLSDWLRECRRICDAERLRWFLHEVETFCHKQFGGTVTTQTEREEVKSFILASEDNVRTAMAVVEAWPETMNEVVGRYLAALRDRIENELGLIEDLRIKSKFGSQEWEGIRASKSAWSNDDGEFATIWFTHDKMAKGWAINVYCELGEKDTKRLRKRLRRVPGKELDDKYVWYRYLDKYGDWSPLLPRLHRETEVPGELTEYFSRELTETVKATVPIIDQILGTP